MKTLFVAAVLGMALMLGPANTAVATPLSDTVLEHHKASHSIGKCNLANPWCDKSKGQTAGPQGSGR